MSTTRILAAFAAAAGCAAQPNGGVWGTVGTWDLVLPVPDSAGNLNLPQQAYQHAAMVPGSLLMLSNVTTAGQPQLPGSLDLYKFNIVTQQWSNPFDFVPPTPTPVQIPFVFVYGGLACVADEAAPNLIYCVDQSISGVGVPWMAPAVSGAPLGRIGLRFLVWGSTLYFFGGFNPLSSPVTQSNDLWALDLTAAITKGAAVWASVSPAPDATGYVPGYPMARIGYSITPYDIGAVMFGGASIPTNSTGNPLDCLFWRGPTAPPQCTYMWHVWALLPGYAAANGQVPAASWVALNNGGSGLQPDGRVLHTAGKMGAGPLAIGALGERCLLTPHPFPTPSSPPPPPLFSLSFQATSSTCSEASRAPAPCRTCGLLISRVSHGPRASRWAPRRRSTAAGA